MQILPGNSVQIIPIVIFTCCDHCIQNKERIFTTPKKVQGSFLKIPESDPILVLSTPIVESFDAPFVLSAPVFLQPLNTTRKSTRQIKTVFILLHFYVLRQKPSLLKEKSPSVETERPLTIACHMKIFDIKPEGKLILTY
jgi:hypothetical protein